MQISLKVGAQLTEMETFSVYIKKVGIESKDPLREFKNSLIQTLCIESEEADEIIFNIPGIVEQELSKPAAEALANILSSLGGVVEVKNSLDALIENFETDSDHALLLSSNEINSSFESEIITDGEHITEESEHNHLESMEISKLLSDLENNNEETENTTLRLEKIDLDQTELNDTDIEPRIEPQIESPFDLDKGLALEEEFDLDKKLEELPKEQQAVEFTAKLSETPILELATEENEEQADKDFIKEIIETKELKVENDKSSEEDFLDFSSFGFEDDEQEEHSVNKTEKALETTLESSLQNLIEDDESSLLDLALAFEESQEKKKTGKITPKEDPETSVSENEKSSSLKPMDFSGLSFDDESDDLIETNIKQNGNKLLKNTENNDPLFQIETESSSQIKTPAPTSLTEEATSKELYTDNTSAELKSSLKAEREAKQPKKHNEHEEDRKKPLVSSDQVEKKTNTASTETSEIEIVKEKIVTQGTQTPQYGLLGGFAVFMLLALYFLFTNAKQTEQTATISPEVMQQLINAQKSSERKKIKQQQETVTVKKFFESNISNNQWNMKSRVESFGGVIENLDINFQVKKVPLPSPEEFVNKKFIPKITTLSLNYRRTNNEMQGTEVSVPARIYTKIGNQRKRFTVPVIVELNDAGRVLSIYSDKQDQSMPPGTYSIEATDENPDTVALKLYFLLPLKEQKIDESVQKPRTIKTKSKSDKPEDQKTSKK